MAQSARPVRIERTRKPWTIGRTVWEIVLFLIILCFTLLQRWIQKHFNY